MSSPEELAHSEYVGQLVSTMVMWVVVLVGGVLIGRSLAKRKGVRMVWWPVILALVLDVLAIAGMDREKRKQEVYESYGVQPNG